MFYIIMGSENNLLNKERNNCAYEDKTTQAKTTYRIENFKQNYKYRSRIFHFMVIPNVIIDIIKLKSKKLGTQN